MEQRQHILSVSGLNTYYGRSHILFDIEFDVRPGETVCLMGRNGVGKTTTFRSLMGLTPPKTGKVILKDQECQGLPSYKMARAGLGFVPEDRRILGPFTVLENLEFGVIPGRRGSWRLDSVLGQFPILKNFTHRNGSTLSGGEQQMLTIARALMGNPELLILDEPTEGLSPVIVGQLKELVLRLKEAGTTILLAEQHLKFAMAVADRVVLLDKGHVVYRGDIAEFREEKSIQKKYLAV
jgi:branched-chain amino acid transport system ATP-binding protein